MFSQLTQLGFSIILYDPPLVIEKVAACVLVALLKINCETEHRFSAQSVDQLHFISIKDREKRLVPSVGFVDSR